MVELDLSIIKQAGRGDQRAFKILYDHYVPYVWKVVYRSVNGDQECAIEVVQDTFVKVHRSLKKFKNASSFSTWLFRIAYTCAMTNLSKRKRRWSLFKPIDDTVAGNDTADTYSTRQTVETVLRTLDPEDRFILTAREVDGISFEELSEITGISSGALRTRIHRIKENLRASFPQEQVYKEDKNEHYERRFLESTRADA